MSGRTSTTGAMRSSSHCVAVGVLHERGDALGAQVDAEALEDEAARCQ